VDFDKTKHLAESTIKQRAQEREKIINQEREKDVAEKKKRELEEIKKAQERWFVFFFCKSSHGYELVVSFLGFQGEHLNETQVFYLIDKCYLSFLVETEFYFELLNDWISDVKMRPNRIRMRPWFVLNRTKSVDAEWREKKGEGWRS